MEHHLTISPKALDKALLVWMQELSPHGICVTDASLLVRGWNLWMESCSGLDKDQVLGRDLREIFPDLRNRRLDAHFEKALAGQVSILSAAFHGYLFSFPSLIRGAEGTRMIQTARIAPLIQEGQVIGTITIIEDVSEREHQNALLRKQHERQELFSWALAQLLEASDPEAMIKEIFPRVTAHIEVDAYLNYLLDPEDGLLRLHSAGGISPEELQKLATFRLGEGFWGVSVLEGRTVIVSRIQDSEDPQAALAREIGLRASVCHPLIVGEKVIGTLAFGTRRRDGFEKEDIDFTRLLSQYVAIAIDRSRTAREIQKAQKHLSLHAEALERKVQERTAKLQESLGELETFSYSLAHDVRAPLRHIKGFGDALIEDCGETIPPQGRAYVSSILRAADKLDALTRDILSYSRISRKEFRPAPIDLEGLLQELVATHPMLGLPGVLNLEQPLHTPSAERFLLEQALGNLVDNALKFVPAGAAPRVTIRTELKQETDGQMTLNGPADALDSTVSESPGPAARWVRIWVEDRGIGISPEFHYKIFKIFERLPTQHEYHGTGIGLAIVAKAIQRMGGRLGVESEAGSGSKFWIELPAADQTENVPDNSPQG